MLGYANKLVMEITIVRISAALASIGKPNVCAGDCIASPPQGHKDMNIFFQHLFIVIGKFSLLYPVPTLYPRHYVLGVGG